MKKSSLLTSFALIAGVSAASSAIAHEREIPQSVLDRYGETLTGTEKTNRNQECSGFRDLISNGNILKRSFGNGQGRSTVHVSPDSGGTIGFTIELGTAGGLKPQDCSNFSFD